MVSIHLHDAELRFSVLDVRLSIGLSSTQLCGKMEHSTVGMSVLLAHRYDFTAVQNAELAMLEAKDKKTASTEEVSDGPS